jgi:hypothetical protein
MRISFALGLILLASIAAGAEARKQAAVPDAAAVAKAEGQAAELFGRRIERAKRPADKSALGREMLDAARKSTDDPAAQYVLARAACGLGAEAKDWPLTLSAVSLTAERFEAGKHEPESMLRFGDEAAAKAKRAEGKGRRQQWQLIAAEWYCRARRAGKGLNGQLADKRLGELAAAMGCRDKDDDLKLLIGTWEVTIGDKWRGQFVFAADGTIHSLRNGKKENEGKWVADNMSIKITWNGKHYWETFFRPIDANATVGDSWQGQGLVCATKKATR